MIITWCKGNYLVSNIELKQFPIVLNMLYKVWNELCHSYF